MRAKTFIALLAGLFLCVFPAAIQAQDPSNPGVALSVTLPDGQIRQLTTHESGLATVIVGSREYGFRPTMHDDEGRQMTITIFDMGSRTEPVRELGTVDVKGGASAAASKTSPSFKVQANRAPRGTTT